MAKITKHQLFVENECDFELIGICAHIGDYRLVWNINTSLNIKLEKQEALFVQNHKKGNTISQHPYYFMHHEEFRWDLYLIKNKFEGKFLIPEKQQIDYFLFICNNYIIKEEEWLEKLRETNDVLAAYSFEPSTLPSAEQILFE